MAGPAEWDADGFVRAGHNSPSCPQGVEGKCSKHLFGRTNEGNCRKLRHRIPKSEFNVPDKRASQPASREVVHAVVGQVVLMQRQSSRAGGLGSIADLFLPT